MATKLKVTAKIGTFTTEDLACEFINNQLTLSRDTFVSSDVREVNGIFKATIVFCNPFDAAECVLMNKSLEEIKTIAKIHKVKLTGEQLVKTTLSREEVERKLETGEINDRFIKYNLDNLFAKGADKYRKTVFALHGVELMTQKVKKAALNKFRLVSKLLMEASTFNYDDYAYEVSFLINA